MRVEERFSTFIHQMQFLLGFLNGRRHAEAEAAALVDFDFYVCVPDVHLIRFLLGKNVIRS